MAFDQFWKSSYFGKKKEIKCHLKCHYDHYWTLIVILTNFFSELFDVSLLYLKQNCWTRQDVLDSYPLELENESTDRMWYGKGGDLLKN